MPVLKYKAAKRLAKLQRQAESVRRHHVLPYTHIHTRTEHRE
jgi:hypothetical protein